MGNCVPVHHKAQNSASKFRCSSYTRTECIQIENPVQENAEGTPVPCVTSFQGSSSSDDLHFHSDPWLGSDCEDFFSVNGDLTPPSSNTPIQQGSLFETPKLDYMDSTLNSMLEPPETDVKKQLIELFHESLSGESGDPQAGNQNLHHGSEAESSTFDLLQSSANVSPYDSVANVVFSGETMSNTNSNPRTRKATESAQCCLPKLVRSLSFSERKRQ